MAILGAREPILGEIFVANIIEISFGSWLMVFQRSDSTPKLLPCSCPYNRPEKRTYLLTKLLVNVLCQVLITYSI